MLLVPNIYQLAGKRRNISQIEIMNCYVNFQNTHLNASFYGNIISVHTYVHCRNLNNLIRYKHYRQHELLRNIYIGKVMSSHLFILAFTVNFFLLRTFSFCCCRQNMRRSESVHHTYTIQKFLFCSSPFSSCSPRFP